MPTHSDFITLRRLENLHVAMPAMHNHTFLCEARRSLHAVYKGSFGSVLHSAMDSPSRTPLAPSGSKV
jgi:hypothetical protein